MTVTILTVPSSRTKPPPTRRCEKKDAKRTQFPALALSRTRSAPKKRTQINPLRRVLRHVKATPLESRIERKAQSGVFLSVMALGTGNPEDSTLRKLAGNYHVQTGQLCVRVTAWSWSVSGTGTASMRSESCGGRHA